MKRQPDPEASPLLRPSVRAPLAVELTTFSFLEGFPASPSGKHPHYSPPGHFPVGRQRLRLPVSRRLALAASGLVGNPRIRDSVNLRGEKPGEGADEADSRAKNALRALVTFKQEEATWPH